MNPQFEILFLGSLGKHGFGDEGFDTIPIPERLDASLAVPSCKADDKNSVLIGFQENPLYRKEDKIQTNQLKPKKEAWTEVEPRSGKKFRKELLPLLLSSLSKSKDLPINSQNQGTAFAFGSQ